MKKHLMTPPPPLATPESGISPEVEKVVHRALEKQPEMRTATVEEFIAELEQAVLQPAPARSKAKRRSTGKATAGTRRRKTTPLTIDETNSSGAGASVQENSSEEAAAPVFAQDVSTLRSPVPNTQSENDTAKLPRPLPLPPTPVPSTKEPEPPPKISEPAPRRADESASSEGNGKGNAPLTSKPPVTPPTEPRLPGRVVIGQQSLVGNFFKRRFAVPVIAGAIILGLIVLLPFVYSHKDPGKSFLQTPATAAANKKREMIFIEGGTFTMGANDAGNEQKGEHSVTVPSFYIDKYEVTNAEYAEFIKDTGRPAPEIDPALKGTYWVPWNGNDPPSGREHWPVANVSPKDVEAFVAWLSKRDGVGYRLPTEEEWEFAARNGSRDSLFPWGNSWQEGRANMNQKQSPVDVGSFPQGETQQGVQDMVGNVWEWTSSKPRFYDNRRVLSSVKNAHVQRGGSFFERIGSDFLNATDRSWFGDENSKFPTIGFRLARDRQ